MSIIFLFFRNELVKYKGGLDSLPNGSIPDPGERCNNPDSGGGCSITDSGVGCSIPDPGVGCSITDPGEGGSLLDPGEGGSIPDPGEVSSIPDSGNCDWESEQVCCLTYLNITIHTQYANVHIILYVPTYK